MTKRFNISLFLSVLIHAVILLFIIRVKTPGNVATEDKNKLEMNFIIINKPIKMYTAKIRKKSTENLRIKVPQYREKLNLDKITIPNIEKSILPSVRNRISDFNPPIFKDIISNNVMPLPKFTNEPKLIPQELTPQMEESNQELSSREKIKVKKGENNSVFIWKGNKREIESIYPMPMPDVLKKIGQNVDVKAEVIVNNLGNVEQVKIIKSSGFLEVDSAVENALLRYKFSPSTVNKNETGIVIIKFVLETED